MGHVRQPTNRTLLQTFEWHTPSDPPGLQHTHSSRSHYSRLTHMLPELTKLGITSLWLPPGCKAMNRTGNGVRNPSCKSIATDHAGTTWLCEIFCLQQRLLRHELIRSSFSISTTCMIFGILENSSATVLEARNGAAKKSFWI